MINYAGKYSSHFRTMIYAMEIIIYNSSKKTLLAKQIKSNYQRDTDGETSSVSRLGVLSIVCLVAGRVIDVSSRPVNHIVPSRSQSTENNRYFEKKKGGGLYITEHRLQFFRSLQNYAIYNIPFLPKSTLYHIYLIDSGILIECTSVGQGRKFHRAQSRTRFCRSCYRGKISLSHTSK